MFLSLICNISILSSFSDHLQKNILKYMIAECGGRGECRTCASLCRSAALVMSCFLPSEGQSHQRSVLYRTALQNSASTGASSACSSPAGAAGISPTWGNARSHRRWAEWCRHIQVTLHGASAGLAGLIRPGLAQHLLGWIWAGLWRATVLLYCLAQ